MTWHHLQSSEVSSQEEFAVQEEKVGKEQVSEWACVCVCVCVCVFYPMPCPSPVLDLALEPPGRITVDTKLLLPGKGFGLLKLRGILPWTFPKENLFPGRFFLLFELRMQEQGFSYLIIKLLIELEFVTLKGKLRCIALWNPSRKILPPSDEFGLCLFLTDERHICLWPLNCLLGIPLILVLEHQRPLRHGAMGGFSLIFLSLISQTQIQRLSCLSDKAERVCQGQLGLD